MLRFRLYVLALIVLTACGPQWREKRAADLDAFNGRLQAIPATCLTLEKIADSLPAATAFLAAAPSALDGWVQLAAALRALYGVPVVRCAIDLARGVPARPPGEMGARGVPAGGGETTHRAAAVPEGITRREALDRLADNPDAWGG